MSNEQKPKKKYKRSARSISVRGDTYTRLEAHARACGTTVAMLVDVRVQSALDEAEKPNAPLARGE